MIASISAVAVMVTYCCDFMNRNSATRKQRGAPQAGLLAVAGVLHAGIDCGEDSSIADAADAGHEDQLRQRAVHFAANELDEGH